jgi:hypothetical protein
MMIPKLVKINKQMNSTVLLKNNSQVESKIMRNQERDIESQNTIIPNYNVNSYLLKPLKGILKNSTNIEDPRTLTAINHFKITLLVVTTTPIFCCDIYFGLYNNYCINETTDGFNFTMKLYLFGSGIVGLVGIISMIYVNLILSDDINNTFVNQMMIIGAIFQIVWDIIGAIKYGLIIFIRVHCDNNILLYILVSLIIKFISHILLIIQEINRLQNK